LSGPSVNRLIGNPATWLSSAVNPLLRGGV